TVTHPAQGECRQQSRASTYPFPYPLPESFSRPYMAPMRGSVGTPAKDRCSKPPVATANPAVLAPGGTCADTPWTPPPPGCRILCQSPTTLGGGCHHGRAARMAPATFNRPPPKLERDSA